MLISIKEAADLLGLKSRGSIYRKVNNGELPTAPGPGGAPMIERDGLEERWASITRGQTNSPKPRQPDDPPVPPRVKREPRPKPPPVIAIPVELPPYNDSRARSEFEKANLLELERKTKEGILLRREDVELAWGQAVNITRTRLLGVPSAAKQRIPHLEVEEVELLTTLIREALEELAAGEVKA